MYSSTLVRAVRRDVGLTQAQLARRMGVSQGAIAQLERVGSNPSVARLEAALGAMGRRLKLEAVPLTSSVDETLLARNLRMTPQERLAAFETARGELGELRRLMPDAG